jgi:hypothetical protein
VPHALREDASSRGGPEIPGTTDCGKSSPVTLFTVARLVCHTPSRRGRAAALATFTPADDALTSSIAALTDG